MTKQESAERQQWFASAFNLGSDARIAGKSLACNPIAGDAAVYWVLGWKDVDHHWGEDARWVTKSLPEVR